METRPRRSIPTAASLWAKLERDASQQIVGWHSLVDHSSDVAAVIAALLAQPTINQRLACAARRTTLDAETCARLAALSSLHPLRRATRRSGQWHVAIQAPSPLRGATPSTLKSAEST